MGLAKLNYVYDCETMQICNYISMLCNFYSHENRFELPIDKLYLSTNCNGISQSEIESYKDVFEKGNCNSLLLADSIYCSYAFSSLEDCLVFHSGHGFTCSQAFYKGNSLLHTRQISNQAGRKLTEKTRKIIYEKNDYEKNNLKFDSSVVPK